MDEVTRKKIEGVLASYEEQRAQAVRAVMTLEGAIAALRALLEGEGGDQRPAASTGP